VGLIFTPWKVVMKTRLLSAVPAALLLAGCASEIVNNSNNQCANLP